MDFIAILRDGDRNLRRGWPRGHLTKWCFTAT
jgi:hypothetical protein